MMTEMARCKRDTYPEPLVIDEEPEHSESFRSMPSEDEEAAKITTVLVGDKLVKKRVFNEMAKKERSGKKLRLLNDEEARERAEDSDYQGTEEDEIEEEGESSTAKRTTTKRKKANKEDAIVDYHELFNTIGFASPVYPHSDTLERLGIKEDVEQLLEGCGLLKFVEKRFPAYTPPAAEFLATVKVQSFPGSTALLELHGGGLITFDFQGKEQVMYFHEINEIFSFDLGEPKPIQVEKDDLNRAWKMLTKEKIFPSQAKFTAIRHPAISYARRVIAQTFFGKYDPSTINKNEMEMLTISFSKFITFKGPNQIQGDQAGAGLAFVLCKHLEGIRGKTTMVTGKSKEPKQLMVGGIITAILKKKGLKYDWEGPEKKSPTYMDVNYLHDCLMLAGPRDHPILHYKYNIGPNQIALITLPNEEETRLDDGKNIIFTPVESLHIDPTTLGMTKAGIAVKRLETHGQPEKKKDLPAGVAATPCICTANGYREKLVAQITRDVETRLREQLHNEMEQGLAELKRKFVVKSTWGTNGTPRDETRHEQRGTDTTHTRPERSTDTRREYNTPEPTPTHTRRPDHAPPPPAHKPRNVIRVNYRGLPPPRRP